MVTRYEVGVILLARVVELEQGAVSAVHDLGDTAEGVEGGLGKVVQIFV
jgi:hypothetical protein